MKVINNKAEGQFELHVDGEIARIIYEVKGKNIYLFSTHVPGSLSGRGIGSALLRGALEIIQHMNLKVVPKCSFVQGWFLKHPEKRHLLA